jgi:hypothetical protein
LVSATLAVRQSDNAGLREAIVAFRLALLERTRERVPLDWAATQNNLGISLRSLGRREGSANWIEEAVAAHRKALGEFTRQHYPLE